jgi:glycosyltransferase involved in cell wall biosynthesis
LGPEHFGFAVAGGYDLPRGKGQREFLMAAARVHERIPRARFLIIGRGSLAEVLRADIARLGLAGKAWLTPYAADMAAVMNAIDCLVHPQIGTEALGLVICEAHACGKPVIASALDGIPEAFGAGNYGRLVRPERHRRAGRGDGGAGGRGGAGRGGGGGACTRGWRGCSRWSGRPKRSCASTGI